MECIPVEPSAPNNFFWIIILERVTRKTTHLFIYWRQVLIFFMLTAPSWLPATAWPCHAQNISSTPNKWGHLQTFVVPKFERPMSAIMAASSSFVSSSASPSSFGRSGASGSKFGRDCEDEVAFGGSGQVKKVQKRKCRNDSVVNRS